MVTSMFPIQICVLPSSCTYYPDREIHIVPGHLNHPHFHIQSFFGPKVLLMSCPEQLSLEHAEEFSAYLPLQRYKDLPALPGALFQI